MSFDGDLYPTAGAPSVLSSKGDIVRYDTERERYGIGSSGQVLAVQSNLPTWIDADSITHNVVVTFACGDETTPVVVVAPPDNQTFNANVVVTADDTILLSSAEVTALAIDDAVTYTNGGGSQDIGLTTATVYYIHSKPDATHVKLKAAVNDLDAIVLTAGSSETGHGLQGATATATATRGSGSGSNVGHPGWVKRTVGTGGRAGRIQYETLVAMSSITGDTADDIEFPE